MTTDLIICTALQQLREFSAEEVGSLTNQYSEMLGQGSFGIVYKGEVGHTRVAVKVIDPVSASFNNDCGATKAFYVQKALKDIGHETFVTELVALTRYTYTECTCRTISTTNIHRFRHPHLINLMGYCRERVTLVYPLMERSLFAALHEYRVRATCQCTVCSEWNHKGYTTFDVGGPNKGTPHDRSCNSLPPLL